MVTERESWATRAGFIIAALASAIGLGNVWRFPFLCAENGGGAFLIPYFIGLFIIGIPMMILEFGLGRLYRGSAPLVFHKIHRKSEIVGWLGPFAIYMICTYYVVICGWCFAYFVYSITGDYLQADTKTFFETFTTTKLPFFYGALMAVAGWIIVLKGVQKGVERVCKWILPILLFGLVFCALRSLTLKGALAGAEYYLAPNFKVLMKPMVWLAAFGQIFFSTSLAMGIMIVYASYLPEKGEITNNAFITCLGDSGFSFIAGFAVLPAVVAFGLAIKGGPGLAFITLPAVISKIRFGELFGIIFFLTLALNGLDSLISGIESACGGLMDRLKLSRPVAVSILCLLMIIISLAPSLSVSTLTRMDTIFGTVMLPFIGMVQCIIAGWLLKLDDLRAYINGRSEIKIGSWWNTLIKYIIPIILAMLFVMTLLEALRG